MHLDETADNWPAQRSHSELREALVNGGLFESRLDFELADVYPLALTVAGEDEEVRSTVRETS